MTAQIYENSEQGGQVVRLTLDTLRDAQNSRVSLPDGYGAYARDDFVKHAETLQGSGGGLSLGINYENDFRPTGLAKENRLDDARRSARLLRFRRLKMARKLLPKERVSMCAWVKIAPYAEGWKSKTGRPAHMRGIVACGTVAVCPVCGAKIREHKHRELVSGIAAARLLGCHVIMLTVTIQHNKKNKLDTVLSHLIESVEKLRGRRAWSRLRKEFEIVGSVTALEITYGLVNGWHPHKHILLFVKNELSAEQIEKMQADIYFEYAKIMRVIGCYAKKDVAIDVRPGNDYIADYVLKYGREPKQRTWGIADEMTKAQLKTSSGDSGHYVPFELLDLAGSGQVWAAEKFKEYAECMKGRKVLTWSNHLRELLGLGVELDDREIAELGEGEDHYPFVQFDWKAWNMARQKLCHVLEDMRVMDFETFKARMSEQHIEIVKYEQLTATGEKRYNADIK